MKVYSVSKTSQAKAPLTQSHFRSMVSALCFYTSRRITFDFVPRGANNFHLNFPGKLRTVFSFDIGGVGCIWLFIAGVMFKIIPARPHWAWDETKQRSKPAYLDKPKPRRFFPIWGLKCICVLYMRVSHSGGTDEMDVQALMNTKQAKKRKVSLTLVKMNPFKTFRHTFPLTCDPDSSGRSSAVSSRCCLLVSLLSTGCGDAWWESQAAAVPCGWTSLPASVPSGLLYLAPGDPPTHIVVQACQPQPVFAPEVFIKLTPAALRLQLFCHWNRYHTSLDLKLSSVWFGLVLWTDI